jgi:hypothetical protein
MTITDYPCDECGYDGPHPAHWDEELRQHIAECGNCALEFGVPAEAVSG